MTATLASEMGATQLPGDRLPRLLPVAGREDLASHRARLGPLRPAGRRGRRSASALLSVIEEAGLVGRGGAAFPTARKLRAVAETRATPVVVVNAMEGEPASHKDRVLLTLAPHLVLDGAEVAARAVGARDIFVCVAGSAAGGHGSPMDDAARSVRAACAERPGGTVAFTLVRPPHRYVSGESSAVARWLDGGPALPASQRVPLARRGVGGRPTLLDNAETFAHLALIAAFGPRWYRALGPSEDPGTTLVTVSGAVHCPSVTEIALGSNLSTLLDAVGGVSEPPAAVLFGGYGGSWADAETAFSIPLGLRRTLTPLPLGPGIVSVLPASACGLTETARVVGFMADESAGQCGPCVHGLPALADALARLVRPSSAGDARTAGGQLERWCDQLAGRGACRHPDGVVRFLRSALGVFAQDVELHSGGRDCGRVDRPGVLPLPGPSRWVG